MPERKKLVRIPEKHQTAVNALVRRLCANYDGGNCLLLDTTCAQWCSCSLLCRYFIKAVLPADKLLHAQLTGNETVKACSVCGVPFHSVSNRAKYCKPCAQNERLKKEALRKQNARFAVSAFRE